MNFREYLRKNIVILDGATGTLLLERGLKPFEYPETMCLTNFDVLSEIHKSYFDAGSNVVCTNTFGANILKFDSDKLELIIKNAVLAVKKAKKESKGKQQKFVALDIGPLGKMFKPLGDLDFNDGVEIFKKTISLGVKYGVDLVYIETMNDSYETKSAVVACKEICDLPILVSNVYDKNQKLLTGASPNAMSCMLEGLKVDGFGANCSLGAKELSPVIDSLLKVSSIPILFKPNAGLPRVENGKTIYDIKIDEFCQEIYNKVLDGARIVGGCCGTSPKFISALSKKLKGIKPKKITEKNITAISSYSNAVYFDKPIIIGERINPTGKKRLKTALIENDIGYILEEAEGQKKNGADVLDINVGIPDIDERKTLPAVIKEVQAVVDLPLQIDSVSYSALEDAVRVYNGKPIINSVNGKQESMDNVFPIVKKYGGVVVCLTMDESGIPELPEERVMIAQKIEKEALKYGITKKDLLFDTLTMTVSSNKDAGKTTLKALSMLHERGYKTILGVSNCSFGLPNRDLLNSSFYTSALTLGLSSAIINPYSKDMINAHNSFLALNGFDENFERYIFYAMGEEKKEQKIEQTNLTLSDCIEKGFKERAYNITEQLLKEKESLDIINNEIIPALDNVGRNYENKKIFLPQLLISAESAKFSFDCIKKYSVKGDSDKGKVVLATVKGDIHDIGKNIVKLLLENYGFNVIDLGKDVPPENICNSVVSEHALVCGLSALMTTTVPFMEETIKQLRLKAPWCKIVIGGAVLTKEYADKIGADKYSKDAMETVRFAENIYKDKK